MTTTAQPETRALVSHRLDVIDLAHLRESPLNTRKHFDQAKLLELKASIEKSGILTPLLVRPNPKFQNGSGPVYEIAAGHRRFRAGKLAGVASALCIVREMDDATFLEVLTIENLQREDVHPLEEAQGFKNLLTLDGYDIKKIATRVGKSESYVYDRMKLLQLIAPAQKLFLAHRFTLAHAILLARLSKDDQKRCLGLDNEDGPMDGGMWENEGDAHPPLGLDDPSGIVDAPPGEQVDDYGRLKPRSVRELQAWIDNHVRFSKPDPSLPHLFAGTAANLEAARASEQKVIEISRDHMLKDDAKHPDGKRTYCVTSWSRADGQPEEQPWGDPKPSKICEYSVLGVVVAGRGRGESFQVCIDKKRCMVHWADAIKERNRREREREKDSKQETSGKTKKEGKPSWQVEQERREAATARAKTRWAKGSEAVLAAIADKLEDVKMDSTGPAGVYLWQLLEDGLYGLDARAKVATRYGLKRGSTPVEFMRHVIMCALIDAGEPGYNGSSELDLQKDLDALRIRVNVKALLDAANPPAKTEASSKASLKAAKTSGRAKKR